MSSTLSPPPAIAEASATEYEALTERCALIDRSDRGKLALDGPDAVEFLNGQVTNELAGLAAGDGCYAAFLTHKGKMLGDLRILAVAPAPLTPGGNTDGASAAGPPAALLLDTERVALEALFDMIRRFKLGYRVQLHKRTTERALLSLVGPRARAVVAAATGLQPAELPAVEHGHRLATVGGRPVRLVNAGAHGQDVLLRACDRDEVCKALLAAGAEPVSELAAEVIRVEHGVPRYGSDIDDDTIPQEAGLNDRAVSFTKGCYVGQETVARLHYRGRPNRQLRGLRLGAPRAAGTLLTLDGRPVGTLASSVISPRLGAIGLALVRREAPPGSTVLLGDDGASAEVVELPFAA